MQHPRFRYRLILTVVVGAAIGWGAAYTVRPAHACEYVNQSCWRLHRVSVEEADGADAEAETAKWPENATLSLDNERGHFRLRANSTCIVDLEYPE